MTSPAQTTAPVVPGATATVRPNTGPTEDAIRGKRGRKPGQVAKEHKAIPASEYTMEDVDADSRGFLKRQRIERSAQQQAVDAKVLEIKQQWEDEGSPTNWNHMPVKAWVISKDFEEEALFQLGKAASLHSLKLVTGKIQRKSLPKLPLPDGKVRIPFCVVSRRTEVTGLPAGSESANSDSE
jgi:hypothetical protein